MIYLKILMILPIFIFAVDLDHLLLSRIVIAPDNAESISIINPTGESINLSDYYICDDNKYFEMQTESDLSPSHFINGFTAQFPNINIEPNETLLLVLSEDYSSFYTDITPDLFLFGEESGSMNETEGGSFGHSLSSKLDDITGSIILFKWDGNTEHNIEDVDYFIWGGLQGAVDKTGEGNYTPDTQADEQFYFEQVPDDNYAFARVEGLEETSEVSSNGNGIMGEDGTRDDETSEDLRQSWEIISLFEIGCTDSTAINYNPDAIIDDGSCEYIEGCMNSTALNYNPDATIDDGTCFYFCQGEIIDYVCVLSVTDITNNCSYGSNETIECDGSYELSASTAEECPLYGQQVTVRGILVDYFDVTSYGGPHSFTISDENGYRIELSIWPSSNEYQDGFDITLTDLDKLRYGPYGNYIIQATGNVGVFCDDDEILNINEEWDVTVEYEYNIVIIEEIGGYFVEDSDINTVSISPAPYVLIPSLGETLDFTFTHPSDSRITVRVFDISGRFITTIKDIYMETSGTHYHGEDPETGINSSRSAWDGRDHLGQIVSPGVYLMHIESYNYTTSKTNSDIAPIVVGVSN